MKVRPIILAAGQGTRMRSELPKVLHHICGRPLIYYVLEAVRASGLERPIIVVGHGRDAVQTAVAESAVPAVFVEQPEQLGTGHAVMQALPALHDADEAVLVMYGDMPLLRAETLGRLLDRHAASAGVTLLTARVEDPTGYGRIVRDAEGVVTAIVEERDASPEQREIQEINTGTYAFAGDLLRRALPALRPDNAKGEYYLTDTVAWALGQGIRPQAVVARDAAEAQGINSRGELAAAEGAMRRRLLEALMEAGVTVTDPHATYVHAGVDVGSETILHPGTSLEGKTRIGRGCVIGPQARLIDAEVGDGVTVVASTVTKSIVGDHSRIGPYSHLRPGTRLGRSVEVGNYAEMKNSTIGDYTKVHHKSYLGDATIGERVNIGAGTITCNLRDRSGKKWQTVIEDEAFIGSDSMLVAPVRIGRGASTGAGSVVTKDVPAGAVVVGVPARPLRAGPEAVPADPAAPGVPANPAAPVTPEDVAAPAVPADPAARVMRRGGGG